MLGRECERVHKKQRGWEMPFLWPPIEEEKYFPRKPARECSHNIQPSFVCTHIATAIHILYAPTNEYIFFCCFCYCGWAIWSEICLCAELFSSIYSLLAFVFVFHSILCSPSWNLFFIDTHDGFLVSLAMPQYLTPLHLFLLPFSCMKLFAFVYLLIS